MHLHAARRRIATPGAYPATLVARTCARSAARCLVREGARWNSQPRSDRAVPQELRVPVLLRPELRFASLRAPVEKQNVKTCPVRRREVLHTMGDITRKTRRCPLPTETRKCLQPPGVLHAPLRHATLGCGRVFQRDCHRHPVILSHPGETAITQKS
ncbi:hypothetical protein BC628DRAFT_1096723 [Trametes gibbosa]|nr:hypothetical protein BC628DRAFT_1096723 [Trametes gibbosa]